MRNVANRITSEQAGAPRNALGILTPDKKRVNPERLLGITGMNPTHMSAIAGISRPQLYKKEIPILPNTKFIKRVLDVVMVTDLAFELFGNNKEETTSWLTAPNSLLFGDSPFEVCMSGQAAPLKKWLLERLGKESITL
jgi:hypothetical protein